MADDRFFDVLRTLNRPLDPEPDYADRLFDLLVAEAGIGSTPRRARPWQVWRGGPARVGLPRDRTQAVILLLILAALLSVTVVVGNFLLRLPERFVEAPVDMAEVEAGTDWSIGTLASDGAVGGQPAVGYGPDGRPVIAYQATEDGRVLVARCADAACSSLEEPVDAGPVISNLAEAFGYLAVGPGGEAWIGRTVPGDGDAEHVEIQRVCPEPAQACDPIGPAALGPGSRPLIEVRPDGRPVILVATPGDGSSDGTSRLVVCGDASCEDRSSTTVPVSAASRDLVLTSGGAPLLVTSRGGTIELVTCRDDACAATTTTSLGPGRQPRLALDAEGRPTIAAFAGRSLVLYRCADPGCSSGTSSTLSDLAPAPADGDEILALDLLVGPDGRPLVSLSAGGEIRIIACSTSACRDATSVTLGSTSPAWAAPHALGVDRDGLPFVAYGVRSDLMVARCLVPDCLTEGAASAEPSPSPTASSTEGAPVGLVRTKIDPGTSKFDPAVAIGADGLPVAAYSSGTDLRVVHCGDTRCETGNTLTTLDASMVQAIAIGPDGNPVVAFIDAEDNSLSVARCRDAACSEASVALVREAADWSQYVAVVVPADDRPIVAFADGETQLRVARCADPDCTASEEAVVDPNPDRWWINSLELRVGSDGLPVVGYALASQGVRIATCADLGCAEPTITVVATETGDLVTSALEIGADGLPVIAYYSDASLQFARCDDVRCSTVTATPVDEATADWWTPIGVGIDPDGLPVIAYFSPTNRDTKLALCEDVGCSRAELVPVAESDAKGSNEEAGIAFLPDGSPVFVYQRGGLIAEVCTDPRCGG